MTSVPPSNRRRQFCARCGQLMFEFHSSPDGHFGLVDDLPSVFVDGSNGVRCPTCEARYKLLERLSASGQPVVRAWRDHDVNP